MRKVRLPADVSAEIGHGGPIELCDQSGAVQAVALPPDVYREMFDLWADTVFDREGLERARAETGGYTTAEAIAYLQKVAADHRP